jgi:4-alpha-glucanotransferase
MKALWERLRAEAKGERGDPDDHWKARRDLRLLCEFASIWAPDDQFPAYSQGVKWQLLASLLRSNSRYAAFMVTDLFGMEDRFNVPGVLDERNWRTRLPWTASMLAENPELAGEAETLAAIIRETDRV